MPEALPSSGSKMLVYRAGENADHLQVRLENDTLWLTPPLMAILFHTTRQAICRHIHRVHCQGELPPTRRRFPSVGREGNRAVCRDRWHYNLDMIISVGYRVNGLLATRFRLWADRQLRVHRDRRKLAEVIRPGQPQAPLSAAPTDLAGRLELIQDIRASEQRMYLRVREIFAMAGDYHPSSAETSEFFRAIQNRLHYAVTGMTAAGLIQSRANHSHPNMGLTHWKGSEIRLADVGTAKNYLLPAEIDELNRIVAMWLDFAEDQMRRREGIVMADWRRKLDIFMGLTDRQVLPDTEQSDGAAARDYARAEYRRFALGRRGAFLGGGRRETRAAGC